MQHRQIQQRLARFAIALCGRRSWTTTTTTTTVVESAAAAAGAGGGGPRGYQGIGTAMKKKRGAAMEGEGEEGEGAPRRARVVIVGAGMAGIAAAQRLMQGKGAGRMDVTILEASERMGGRICSTEFNGEGIELGATWIHGIEGSPLYKMAKRIGAMKSGERAWEGKDGFLDNVVLKAEGGMDVAPELVEPVVEVYKQLMQEAQEPVAVQAKEMVAGATAIGAAPVKITESSNCTSVGAFLQQGLDRFLAQEQQQHVANHQGCPDESFGSPWTTRSLQEGCFKMHANLERDITSADDLYDIDLEDYNEYLEFPGEHKSIAKGYSSLVHAFASSLPSGVVQFGKFVEKIVWKDSRPDRGAPVNIHCEGGSILEADHVIITVSLGVLKARTLGCLEGKDNASEKMNARNSARTMAAAEADGKAIKESYDNETAAAPPVAELFDPPLPLWKLSSISRLGFGVVDKVFVRIKPAVDGDQHRPLQFIFDPRGVPQKSGKQLHHSDIPAWIRKTYSLYPIHEKSHSLVAWFAGREALQVESLTDEEILSGISKTLASFGIPESQQGTFLGVRRSGWGQNPLFRGSYSYVKVGSTGEDIDTLAEPLPKSAGDTGAAPLQILFAGEATHRYYYSTTHGAYFSGLREAERLLLHYGLLV